MGAKQKRADEARAAKTRLGKTFERAGVGPQPAPAQPARQDPFRDTRLPMDTLPLEDLLTAGEELQAVLAGTGRARSAEVLGELVRRLRVSDANLGLARAHIEEMRDDARERAEAQDRRGD